MSVEILLVTFCFVSSATPFESRLVKRIANGFPLNSHQDYQTYHFIAMRKMWGCVTDQSIHEIEGCIETSSCGGTLFHPEFVISAAHCADYDEYYLREQSDIYDPQSVHLRYRPLEEEDGAPNTGVHVHIVNPKIVHQFYSNKALLAGSVDYFNSEQKRHAYKVFPHPAYPAFEGNSYFQHDIAIIQVCEPFEIKGNVRIAPVMPLHELTNQFEGLVRRSTACLYIGFGNTDDKSNKFRLESGHSISSEFMRYTWRQTACQTICNSARYQVDQTRNPCFLCSEPIGPRFGTPRWGDSGGPIVCDGYYVAVITTGIYDRASNKSKARGYPLHCIKDAITSLRLEYYKTVPAGDKEFHPLGPVSTGIKYDSRHL